MHPPDDDGPPDFPLPSDAVPMPGAEPPGNPIDRLKYGRNWSEPRVRSRAEASLVANTIAALLCFGFVAVAGVVLAALAFARSDTDPDQARLFVRLSWLCLVVSLAVSVVLLVVGVVNPVIAWIGHVVSLF
ncbi:MAG TPA: hypothetical protein VGL93_35070 [Streptosporangiaceae bacterium]|jgi:hypothetical protein